MLALHNFKKSKGQSISFGIIICISALIMNIALVLAGQSSDAYDERFDELDTAQINVLVPEILDKTELEESFSKINGAEKVEKHSGVYANATVKEFQGSDFDMNTVFYSLDEQRTINLLKVSEYSDKNAVYVPKYLTELGGMKIGGNITYVIGGEDITWKIGGNVEEMQYGNYGTGLIGAYLPQELYEKLAESGENVTKIAEYSIKTKDGADLAAMKKDISKILSDNSSAAVSVSDKETAKQSRTMVCSLLIAIFIALAAIILVVSIFLSNFKIRNTIEAEMTEMGVLKALGYTSPMIIKSNVLPYTATGVISAAAGAALSYALLPLIANILGVQSGFEFSPKFDAGALALTIIIPAAAIFAFAYIAAGKIRSLQPINAIRGITGGSADKNHIELENTRLPVKAALVFKQIVNSMRQNILLFAVSFGIMVLISFAGVLFYNVNIKPDNFINTLQEESPSVIFTAKDTDALRQTLVGDSRVDKVLGYASEKVSYADGSLTAFVCEDFSKVTNDICYDGKNPANENETALGSALSEKYKLGDEIKIISGEKAASFTVVGFVQSVNNGGTVCELTEDGFKRISEKETASLNVYLKEKGAEGFINEYESTHGELVKSSVNYEKLSESASSMYSGIVSAVTAVVLIISTLVVLLVMYVIINSMLTRRRQEFGIYKAVGWSSAGLILQNAASFLPAAAGASVVSAALGLLYLPAMNKGIFSMLGAYKNHFEIPLWFLLIFAALFVGICFLISVLLARPIKKITAYSLLKE